MHFNKFLFSEIKKGLLYPAIRSDYMNREKMAKSLDEKIFKRTASSVKAINITPKIMRGGTRL